ncbi:Acidic mammalian chitinase [Hypsibius exemplaris]|uniref:Acidic mammalian chitinase n=1 Tax=Hypsibius exemplaris TaxID=2072580 RepID=A0A1W0WTC0_HYPEX|nr:Acidic mammalian chitinase [Hypsibius exemplaris]
MPRPLVLLLCLVYLSSSILAIQGLDAELELPHRGCYYTNWAQYRSGMASHKPENIDPTLCTWIAVAFAKIDQNELTPLEWNDEGTFTKLVNLKTVNPKLKILLSIGGWTLTKPLVEMSSTAAGRATFVASSIKNLRKWALDGLDVDWEFPHAADKAIFSTLLMELRDAFEKEAKETGKPRLLLGAAVHLISDGGFDGASMNRTLDIVNVMVYDLEGPWDVASVGHQAPLFKGPFSQESPLNVEFIMREWVAAGISKAKLLLGLPLYGRGWLLTDGAASHGLNASATGPITMSAYTGEAGSWPFYEICDRIVKDKATVIYDENIQASYAFTNSWWIGYDDVRTITTKTKWMLDNGFGGVYVWDLAQDDFFDLCGLGRYPLLKAVLAATAAPPATTTITCTQPLKELPEMIIPPPSIKPTSTLLHTSQCVPFY